jgi:hypothetical protein
VTRLVMSTDGGHIWHVLDTQLATSGRSAEAYAVNLANPATFYGLAFVPVAPGTGFPPLELYKSLDGGQMWQSVLQRPPWMAPLSPSAISTGSAPSQLAYMMGGGVVDRQGRLYTQATTAGTREIWRYDPATALWSKVAQAPYEGTLLAGTSTGANSATALRLMSTSGQEVLYRSIL